MGDGTSVAVNKKWVTVRDKSFEDTDRPLTGITSIYAIGSDGGTTFYALRGGPGEYRSGIFGTRILNDMLYGWGYNAQRQLGLDNVTEQSKAVMLLTNVEKFFGRTTAYASAFAIRNGIGSSGRVYNNELWVAGDNMRGQLGVVGDNVEWQKVSHPDWSNGIESVYGSSDDYSKRNHTFTIVKPVGLNTLYGTGDNSQGQLGLGHNNDITTFTKINFPVSSPILDIECGYRVSVGGYTFIHTADSSLYHTGINRFGWSSIWASTAPKAFFTKINNYVLG